MSNLADHITASATNAVGVCQELGIEGLDYSPVSLGVLERVLSEATGWATEMPEDQVVGMTQDFGCYILEVARREFGGVFLWHDGRDQPVLVVGDPVFRVAMITWDKVRSRLNGDPADNIPFFYAGFASRVREAKPGNNVLYV